MDIEKILDGIADFMLNSETYDEVMFGRFREDGNCSGDIRKGFGW